jgi:small subunit ribosomal protein S20
MPNIKSAAKRVRQTEVRTLRNRALKSRVKTFRKKLATAVAEKQKDAAEATLRELFAAADKAAKKNVLQKNTVARYKSAGARLVATLG